MLHHQVHRALLRIVATVTVLTVSIGAQSNTTETATGPYAELAKATKLLGAGQHLAAEQHLRRALSLRSDMALAWHLLGECSELRQAAGEAIERYTTALTIQPDHLPTLLRVIELRVQQHQTQEARRTLDRALESAATDHRVQLLAARVELLEDKTESALQRLVEVAKVAPEDDSARFLLFEVHLQRAEAKQAEVVVRELVQRRPRDPVPQLSLARLLLARGDLVEAADRFEIALQLRPWDQDSRREVLRILARIPEPDPERIARHRALLEVPPPPPSSAPGRGR
jgi:Tfp pilus assembly protein PilF